MSGVSVCLCLWDREREEKERAFLVAAGEYTENHAWRWWGCDSSHTLPWDNVPKCYQTQVQLLPARKSVARGQVLLEREVAFNQNVINLGRRWTQGPPKLPLKILLYHEDSSREKGSNLSYSLRERIRVITIPHWMQVCQFFMSFL